MVAINDANLERAKSVVAELGVEKIYTTPQELCADPEVEAIAIITNTNAHVEMIKIAMEASKHVFCEKPLSDKLEACYEAEKIIEAHPKLIFPTRFPSSLR